MRCSLQTVRFQGICVFQLSRLVGEKSPDDMAVIVDLLPDYAEETVLEMLKEKQKRLGEMGPMPLLEGFINKRAAQEALKRAGVSLNSSDLPACVHAVKRFRFDVTGTMDFRHAQVTSGGVPLQEVEWIRWLHAAAGIFTLPGRCWMLTETAAAITCIGRGARGWPPAPAQQNECLESGPAACRRKRRRCARKQPAAVLI